MTIDTLPLFSIITPSFNQGKFIEDTILSVKNQDYPNIEHIVVDGGSKDCTLEILKKYENTYNLKWLSEPDQGQADALNKGFGLAKGMYIGWINSDDCYFDINAISSAVKYFNKYPEYDVIYGDAIRIDENNNFLYVIKERKFSYDFLTKACFLVQPSVFLRRCVIDNFRLNTALNLAMDYDFWLRIAQRHKFKYINRVFSVDRAQSQRKTIVMGDTWIKEASEVSEKYYKFSFMDRVCDYPSYKLRFIRRWITILKIYNNYEMSFPMKLDNIFSTMARNFNIPKKKPKS
jgi:glycosyltransferase involved in cell wall biosynthesis